MPESSPTPLRDLLGEIDANAEKVWPEDRGARIAKCSSEALARLDDAMKHISAIKELTYVNRVEDTNTHFRKILEHAAALAALVGDAS